jgi:hypothetical protein
MTETQIILHSSSQVSDFMQQMTYLPSLIIDTISQAAEHRSFQEKSAL